MFFVAALYELATAANEGENPEDLDRQEEMSVRVREGGFMTKSLQHYNFGPNVVSETLEL